MTDDNPTGLGDIEQALRNLEELGLVRRTGEFRDGKPLYEAVKLGSPVNFNVPKTRH